MANSKAAKLWFVNVLSAVLIFLLGLTGLTNWWILPRGFEARGSVWFSLRHALVEVHGWLALAFLACIAIHLSLHWSYVVANLKKYGLMKSPS
jgi:hypothetical protein